MSATSIKIDSHRMGMVYTISKFTEYKIDIDLETDADGFNIVIENPNGEYSGIINPFDTVTVLINDTPVLKGSVDRVLYHGNASTNNIQIIGRDMMGILVSNDALPCTKYNVNPTSYFKSKCSEYGITKCVAGSVPVVKKIIIGSNESEISVITNMLMDSRKRVWTIYDTAYLGDWNTNADPSYTFVRGVTVAGAIPIESVEFSDDATDMKSEVRIYGSMSDGSQKVMGTSTNDYLVKRGIKRRQVMESSNNDSSTKYASTALKHIRDGFRDGKTLEITIFTDKATVLPNRTAHIIDKINNMNSVFFIKCVSYSKSIHGGSITNITMIPGDTSFDVIWKNQSDKKKGNVIGAGMSVDEVLKTRR